MENKELLIKKIQATKEMYIQENKFLDVEMLEDIVFRMYKIYTSSFTTRDKISFIEEIVANNIYCINVKELLYYSRFISNLVNVKDAKFVAKKVSYNIKINDGFYKKNYNEAEFEDIDYGEF